MPVVCPMCTVGLDVLFEVFILSTEKKSMTVDTIPLSV